MNHTASEKFPPPLSLEFLLIKHGFCTKCLSLCHVIYDVTYRFQDCWTPKIDRLCPFHLYILVENLLGRPNINSARDNCMKGEGVIETEERQTTPDSQ